MKRTSRDSTWEHEGGWLMKAHVRLFWPKSENSVADAIFGEMPFQGAFFHQAIP
jgi:hypothetical protein